MRAIRSGRGIIIGIFIGNAMTACGDDGTLATDSASAGGSTSAGSTTAPTTGSTTDTTGDLPTTSEGTGSAGTLTTTSPTTTDTTSTPDTTSTTATTGSTGTPEPVCGDGVIDPGEECDDGNVAYMVEFGRWRANSLDCVS